MTLDELEAELLKLFSTIGGGAATLERARVDTLECWEEVREEDVSQGAPADGPFVNLVIFNSHTSTEAPFLLTAFQHDSVVFHVGSGLPEPARELIVQSSRSQQDEIESEILRLAHLSSTMKFPRPLVERWLTK